MHYCGRKRAVLSTYKAKTISVIQWRLLNKLYSELSHRLIWFWKGLSHVHSAVKPLPIRKATLNRKKMNAVWLSVVRPQDSNYTWAVMSNALPLNMNIWWASPVCGHLGVSLSSTQLFWRGCHWLDCCQNSTKMAHTAYARRSLCPNVIWSPSACAFLLKWNQSRSPSAELSGTQHRDLTWNDPR